MLARTGNDFIPPATVLFDTLGLDCVERLAAYVGKFDNEAKLLEDYLFLYKEESQKHAWHGNFKLARAQFDFTIGYPQFAAHARFVPFLEVCILYTHARAHKQRSQWLHTFTLYAYACSNDHTEEVPHSYSNS